MHTQLFGRMVAVFCLCVLLPAAAGPQSTSTGASAGGASTTSANAALSDLQKLVAVQDIKKLRARYANTIDYRHWNAWRDEVLAPDIVFDVPDDNDPAKRVVIKGSQAVVSYLRPRMGDKPGGSHAVTIPDIDITSPTTARGLWRLSTSTYHDTYVKRNGQWRIQSLKLLREPGGTRRPVAPPRDAEMFPPEPHIPPPWGATPPARTVTDIERLTAIDAIEQLKARHGDDMDFRRWDDYYENVAAPDVVMDLPPRMNSNKENKRFVLKGREAVVAHLRRSLGDGPTGGEHIFMMPYIEITSPTTARAIWRQGGAGTSTNYDTYEKINGQWRIKSLMYVSGPGPGGSNPVSAPAGAARGGRQ